MRHFALLFLLVALPLTAAPSDDKLLDELIAVKTFEGVAITPDGKHVAWAVADGGVYLDGKLVMAKATAPAFSPDGKSLAFFGGEPQAQLYVAPLGGAPKKLTDVTGFVDQPRWSPNGASIAFRYIEHAKRTAGALAAMSRAVGVIEETIDEARLAIVDVGTKKLTFASPADMFVYEFAWYPDSKRIAATTTRGSGENNYWTASLWQFPAARELYKPTLQIASPIVSPDGSEVAIIEGLMSDQGSTGGDIIRIASDGTATNAMPKATFSATSLLQWTADGLTFRANMSGATALARLTGSEIGTLWRGQEQLSEGEPGAMPLARDGRTSAFIRSSFEHPPEVWAGPIGAWKQVTHANTIAPRWGEVKSLMWRSDDFDVQGWLVLPRNYSPAKKYPLVTIVHGGPASSAMAAWPSERTGLILAQDWITFLPNPRGSFGRGEAFTRANVQDFGHGDLRDILRGIDTIETAYPVDDHRLGIYGWSYGGYMTMWTVTQTNRFRAAVAGAGLSNWQSYYGTNSIDQWMIPYFGASVYDDPAVYAKSSPMTFIKNVKTPTLVVAGERDGEVPPTQSFEFWHALKTLGVKTQLVIYADEGHRFSQPAHKRDVARRIVGWLEEEMR